MCFDQVVFVLHDPVSHSRAEPAAKADSGVCESWFIPSYLLPAASLDQFLDSIC